jgi:hypothetical protein
LVTRTNNAGTTRNHPTTTHHHAHGASITGHSPPTKTHLRKMLETGRSECQMRRTPEINLQGKSNAQGNPRRTKHHTDEEGQDKGFCQRRMVTAGDPCSHMYGGSSEFNVAAFSTTFDRRSFGRRIVAKINTNINEPTISADQSWAL